MSSKSKSGVYAIEHVGSGRRYIRSSKSIYQRWNSHRKHLSNGVHHSPYLQNVWSKYGANAFRFVVLEECLSDRLLIREQHYIDSMKPEFNVCPLARSRLGSKQRPEVREKVADKVRARAALITHCPKGHEYTPENTGRNGSGKGKRYCKKCNAERVASVVASRTPDQMAAAKEWQKSRYYAKYEQIRSKQNAYAAANREKKREYDRANRARSNELRRARNAQAKASA